MDVRDVYIHTRYGGGLCRAESPLVAPGALVVLHASHYAVGTTTATTTASTTFATSTAVTTTTTTSAGNTTTITTTITATAIISTNTATAYTIWF